MASRERDQPWKESVVSDLALAAVIAGTVLLASTISVEVGLSVALIELLAGVVVGNARPADSQAALLVFILGLAMSRFFASHRMQQERMCVVSFAFLTPFLFLKGGLNVSTGALWESPDLRRLLLVAKMAPRLIGVYALARRFTAPHAASTTLLMSTDLTFGTITSLYGLSAGDHRPDAVLASDCSGRAVGGRADRDRAAVLPAGVRDSPRRDGASRAGARRLAVCRSERDEQAAVVVERGEEVTDDALDLAASRS
jgi:Kef-type K+ transport system membrane component KefB